MEYTSNIPGLDGIVGTYRWGTACDVNQQILPGGTYAPPGIDWARDFHTFSVDWSADSMDFAVDGHIYETKTSAEVVFPTAPMYLVLNTAIAWFWPPGASAVYPTEHVIDWVRISQQD